MAVIFFIKLIEIIIKIIIIMFIIVIKKLNGLFWSVLIDNIRFIRLSVCLVKLHTWKIL